MSSHDLDDPYIQSSQRYSKVSLFDLNTDPNINDWGHTEVASHGVVDYLSQSTQLGGTSNYFDREVATSSAGTRDFEDQYVQCFQFPGTSSNDLHLDLGLNLDYFHSSQYGGTSSNVPISHTFGASDYYRDTLNQEVVAPRTTVANVDPELPNHIESSSGGESVYEGDDDSGEEEDALITLRSPGRAMSHERPISISPFRGDVDQQLVSLAPSPVNLEFHDSEIPYLDQLLEGDDVFMDTHDIPGESSPIWRESTAIKPDHVFLAKNMLFSSKEKLQKAVKLLHFSIMREYAVSKSSSTKWRVKCKREQCPFRLTALMSMKLKHWVIKKYIDLHTCDMGLDHEGHANLDTNLIVDVLIKKLIINPRYHFDGSTRKFFEGWFFKVSIPECRQSFCFIYTVESPSFTKKLSSFEELQYGPRFTGVGAQILGADDKYICQYSEESSNFWGSTHELMLGNTFIAQNGAKPTNKEVRPQEFNRRVTEGFQVTPLWHQGSIRDDGRTDYTEIVKTASWEYSTRPIYGWGDVNSKQKSTAGWPAAFPVFEPHWQVCMAAGLSTGWIEWDGQRFEFQNAPSYSEKNWGGAFPRKWFWVQCSVFEGASRDVALTSAGGLRRLPGLSETFESVALIGIHYGGIFYEFVPWNASISWEITPWGKWHISAETETHMVELDATAEDPGTTLLAPTEEMGLAPACRDTCLGDLRLQLWERKSNGNKGKVVLDVTSNMAGLEVGGGPWFNTWKANAQMPEIVTRVINVPVDLDGIFSLVPFLKPPGL